MADQSGAVQQRRREPPARLTLYLVCIRGGAPHGRGVVHPEGARGPRQRGGTRSNTVTVSATACEFSCSVRSRRSRWAVRFPSSAPQSKRPGRSRVFELLAFRVPEGGPEPSWPTAGESRPGSGPRLPHLTPRPSSPPLGRRPHAPVRRAYGGRSSPLELTRDQPRAPARRGLATPAPRARAHNRSTGSSRPVPTSFCVARTPITGAPTKGPR